MNNLIEFDKQINYSGRLIDQVGVGLSMLLSNIYPSNMVVYHCLSGRPFEYSTKLEPNAIITPYLNFSQAVTHAIDVLNLNQHTKKYIINSQDVNIVSFTKELNNQLHFSPVLIGPFLGKCFENEFIHSYIKEARHCLLCIWSSGDNFHFLHPDGQILLYTGEELFNMLKSSNIENSMMVSLKTVQNGRFNLDISLQALFSGANLVRDYIEKFGSAFFIKQLINNRNDIKKTITNDITLRFYVSELSINMCMINELVLLVLKRTDISKSIRYELLKLTKLLTNIQSICSNLLSQTKDILMLEDKFYIDFMISWEKYEHCLIKLLFIKYTEL